MAGMERGRPVEIQNQKVTDFFQEGPEELRIMRVGAIKAIGGNGNVIFWEAKQ